MQRLQRKSSRFWLGDFKEFVVAEGRFRLVAAVQVSKTNDCRYRKQSLHEVFREGQLYPLKLPVRVCKILCKRPINSRRKPACP